jgi:hypothetical protein
LGRVFNFPEDECGKGNNNRALKLTIAALLQELLSLAKKQLQVVWV